MIEYEDMGDFIQCWTERECGPFDRILIGSISKSDDGFWRLHTAGKLILTCGHLRRLVAKISELNA